MDVTAIKQKLQSYNAKDIIIVNHARIQALSRNIDLEDVKKNIQYPNKLVFAREQPAKKKGERKFDCYFVLRPNYYHRYIIVFDGKLIIVTIIAINRDWQRAIESRK